ncbi:MAG: hypothetical protein QOJ30_3018 [Pseudonocardiales bacterium]|jgi:hypothetical protein|nr:hypothetical protein [Pseudonocardiales bacterium]
MTGRTLDRVMVGMLEACCRKLWGFAPAMIPKIVGRKGAFGALGWFIANMPRYLVSLYVLGPVRFHLAGMAISLYNNCVYCAFGHGYALELVFLRDKGRLFPLDARTLEDWLHLEPRQLEDRLRAVLHEAGLHAESMWVDRTLALASGDQQPVDGTEARLAHMVRMLGTMNRIAIESGCVPDQAQNPVNKNLVVKARHTELRAAASV